MGSHVIGLDAAADSNPPASLSTQTVTVYTRTGSVQAPPQQFTPSVADDPEALKKLAPPDVGKAEALWKLRSYWSRLGFCLSATLDSTC